MNINQFLYATVLGMILALLAEATGSIIAPMIMHFIFNANSVTLTYLLELLEKLTNSSETEQLAEETVGKSDLILVIYFYVVIGLVAGVIAFLLLMLIAKRCKRWEHIKSIFKANKSKEKKKILAQDVICTILYWMAIVVAVLVMIINEIAL